MKKVVIQLTLKKLFTQLEKNVKYRLLMDTIPKLGIAMVSSKQSWVSNGIARKKLRHLCTQINSSHECYRMCNIFGI